MSVLIVTSEQAAFESTRRLLAEDQCQVWEAGAWDEALLTILDNHIDVVILDTEPSEGIDLNLAPVIKRLRPKISLIPLLDSDSMSSFEKVIGCGIAYHAMKPVSEIEIVQVVKAMRERLYPGESRPANDNLVTGGGHEENT